MDKADHTGKITKKAYDYKKEYKDIYMPGAQPQLITVPAMNFAMVDGEGDPNGNPLFEAAVGLLYGISFTIKMSKMKGNTRQGYFDYVVPPLEGLWRVKDGAFSLTDRENWQWTVMIRQPEFVTPAVFEAALSQLSHKKSELDTGKLRFERFDEGLCVQAMHNGPYASEPETMQKLKDFISNNGLIDQVDQGVGHHEIYLSDPRRGKPENMRTVLRHPVLRSKP